MRRVVFTTLGAIIFFFIFMYVRLGMYKSVKLAPKQLGPFNTIYLEHTGPYYKVSEKIDLVEKWAKENGVECSRTFGEYLDDPKSVAEDRLQSHGGCLVDKIPSDKKFLEGMKSGVIASRQYLTASFDGAPSVGPYTVYPKAFDWMKENNKSLDGPTIEIYTVLSPKEVQTEYLFPIK